MLNPLRANRVNILEDWLLSSCPIVAGYEAAPVWLDTDWLLGQFGTERSKALLDYREFVMSGREVASPLQSVRHQLLLGDDAFLKNHSQNREGETLREVSKAHRKSVALSLDEYLTHHPDRDTAMAQAYRTGTYTMAEIGGHLGVHYMTVSRAVRKCEASLKGPA